ncbi:MAG TPA: hypothetical protein VIM63_01960 [Rhodoferax sp.]
MWASTWVEVWDCCSRDRQSFKDVKFGGAAAGLGDRFADVANINPYLVAAADVVLDKCRTPICPVHDTIFSSMPNGSGNLPLPTIERNELLNQKCSCCGNAWQQSLTA